MKFRMYCNADLKESFGNDFNQAFGHFNNLAQDFINSDQTYYLVCEGRGGMDAPESYTVATLTDAGGIQFTSEAGNMLRAGTTDGKKGYAYSHSHGYGIDTGLFKSSLPSSEIPDGETLCMLLGVDFEPEKLEQFDYCKLDLSASEVTDLDSIMAKEDLYVTCDKAGLVSFRQEPVEEDVTLGKFKEYQRREIVEVLHVICTVGYDNETFIVPALRAISMGLGGSPLCSETDPVQVALDFSEELKSRIIEK